MEKLCILIFATIISTVHPEYQVVKGKHDFVSAIQACSELGGGWRLPEGQALGTGLVDEMVKNGITSAWLSIFRRTLVKWQWVDGMPDETFDANTKHMYCAMLKLTGEIVPTTCVSQGIGLVCEIPAVRSCPEQQSCFHLNTTKFYIDCTLTDWYGARSICFNYGGDLIILDTIGKVRQVAKRLAFIENTLHCQKVFVGLYREDWLAIDPKDDGRVLFTTKWALGQPSPLQHRRCAEAVKNTRGFEAWNAKSCLAKNSVICYKESIIAMPTAKPLAESTWVHSTIQSTTDIIWDKTGRSLVFEICIGIITATLITMTLILVYCMVKKVKEKRKTEKDKNKNEDSEEELLEKETETSNQPTIVKFQEKSQKQVCTNEDETALVRVEMLNIKKEQNSEQEQEMQNDVMHMKHDEIERKESSVIIQTPEKEILENSSTYAVLLCCGGKISSRMPNKVIPVTSISFSNRQSDDVVIGVNMSMLHKLTLYHLRCDKDHIDSKETELLLDFIEKNEEGLKMVYLPGLTLDKLYLQRLREISKRVICVCTAYYESSHETAAETIAFGFVHGDFFDRNNNISPCGFLDFTLRVGNDCIAGTDAVKHALRVVNQIALLQDEVNEKNVATICGATSQMRRKIIDAVSWSKRPDHHPVRGFGLLADENESRFNGSVEEAASFTQPRTRQVSVAILSTGWDVRKRVKNVKGVELWNVTAMGDDSFGDRDTAWFRGTYSMNILIKSLQLGEVNKADVKLCYAIIDTCNSMVDWQKYFETLQRIIKEKVDVIYLSAGLGMPPSTSGVHKLLHDLRSTSVVITNAMNVKNSSVLSDFPSASVISIRNGYKEMQCPLDSSVDFDVTSLKEMDQICNGSWTGAVRIAALTSRIIHLLLKHWSNIPDEVMAAARTTVGMREILNRVCSRGYSKDGVKMVNPEMPLPEEIIAKVKNCFKSNEEFYYWAGKNM